MKPGRCRRLKASAGFTLIELVVASMLMAIVLAGVYMTFSTAVRSWRSAESNYDTFVDARRAMGMLNRELHAIPNDARHLVRGGPDWIEFVTLARPMDVEADSSVALMRVSYRVKKSRDGTELIREEAPVEGPLPAPPEQPNRLPGQLRVGRSHEFTLAKDVLDFTLRYTWAMPPPPRKPGVPPPRVAIVGDAKVDYALPEGIEATLTLRDPANVANGEQSGFQTVITFRSATSPVPAYLVKRERRG